MNNIILPISLVGVGLIIAMFVPMFGGMDLPYNENHHILLNCSASEIHLHQQIANYPSIGLFDGSNLDFTTCDFDSTTEENAYWVITRNEAIPNTDDIQAKIYYAIEGTDGVCWSLAFRSVADDEIIDGAISPLTTLCDETTVTGDLNTLEMTIPSSTHDISQDDLIIVILKRAVDNVTDTNTADAKFIAMEILWN